MKQSGGELNINSTPGEGTTVQLAFSPANAKPEQPQSTLNSIPVEGGLCVLLVEDEDQIRNVTTMVLEQAGYNVAIARDGEDALKKSRHIDHLDLLITDSVMPGGISGDQLIRELRKTNPDLPVLLISGYSTNIPTEYTFLSKPFSSEALLNKVQHLTANAPAN